MFVFALVLLVAVLAVSLALYGHLIRRVQPRPAVARAGRYPRRS
jgi:hypothetical protein